MTSEMAHRVEIIAEAGVNHNGDADIAISLIDAAAGAKADTIKFQTFRPEDLASRAAPKAPYQEDAARSDATQLDMLRGLALDVDAHKRLVDHCERRQIRFLSTPFDLGSLALLSDVLGLRRVKIGSGDLTNAPLLLEAARRDLDLILSTGMATTDEIAEALGAIAFGYSDAAGAPSRAAFKRALESPEGGARARQRVVLLQCTTAYPTAFEEANIRAMETLSRTFECRVGFSDHTIGSEAAIAAVALGATVIEKHLTLDRAMPGPDHQSSIEPDRLTEMISAIRNVELALGDGDKAPTRGERENMMAARKSLVARTSIKKGEPFSSDNLAVKRPASGVPPAQYWEWIGRVADRDYHADEVIGA